MTKESNIPKLKPSEHQEWLRTLYKEAWQQYSHEDNIYQTRNNLFLGLQTVLIGILTGISPLLIKLQPIKLNSYEVSIGFTVLGFIAIVFSIIGLNLTRNWERLTHAARAYLSLRLSTARIIEIQLGLNNLGLVEIENRWSIWSKEKQEHISKNPAFWYPSGFKDETGKDYEIRPRPKSGGFDAHLGVVKLLRTIWYIFCITGLLLFGSSLKTLI